MNIYNIIIFFDYHKLLHLKWNMIDREVHMHLSVLISNG